MKNRTNIFFALSVCVAVMVSGTISMAQTFSAPQLQEKTPTLELPTKGLGTCFTKHLGCAGASKTSRVTKASCFTADGCSWRDKGSTANCYNNLKPPKNTCTKPPKTANPKLQLLN